jgi:hypothetical protein
MSTPWTGVAVGVIDGLLYAVGGDTDSGGAGFLARTTLPTDINVEEKTGLLISDTRPALWGILVRRQRILPHAELKVCEFRTGN